MKAKVKSVYFSKEKEHPQYGKFYVFNVTFENGDKGTYLSKTNPQNYFTQGQEAEYTAETKPGQNGEQYVTIKPIRAQGGGKFGANPVHENKRTALKCASLLAAHGVIHVDKINTYCNSFMKYLSE